MASIVLSPNLGKALLVFSNIPIPQKMTHVSCLRNEMVGKQSYVEVCREDSQKSHLMAAKGMFSVPIVSMYPVSRQVFSLEKKTLPPSEFLKPGVKIFTFLVVDGLSEEIHPGSAIINPYFVMCLAPLLCSKTGLNNRTY